MSKDLRWVLLILIACKLTPATAAAEVFYDPGLDQMESIRIPRITVYGQISLDDLTQFMRFARMAGHRYGVYVNSPGGDLYASMAIGRLIRRDKRAIFVMPNSECLSSCVFILAGGVMRYVAADPARPTQVGIHRPYDPGDTLTTAGQQKLRYAQVEKDAKAYLREMNVPTELWDHMLRIPPGEIKPLNRDELQKYGLSENDPYWEAAFTAREAAGYGITVGELLQRKARVKAECKYPPDFLDRTLNDAAVLSIIVKHTICERRIINGVKAECLTGYWSTMSDAEIDSSLRKEVECSKSLAINPGVRTISAAARWPWSDPDFLALPDEEKRKVLIATNPDFAALSPERQTKVFKAACKLIQQGLLKSGPPDELSDEEMDALCVIQKCTTGSTLKER